MSMTRHLLIACLAFSTAFPVCAVTPITPAPAHTAGRVATVQVRVAPDHRDWTYQPGENARFTVTITADNEPLEGAVIQYKVGPEMLPAQEKTAAVSASSSVVIDGGTLPQPGFIRCIVTTEVGGKTYRGLATAGFAPEKIQPTQTEPADFDAFWDAGKAELARIPLEPQITLLPEACTPTVNVYHVSFRTVGSAGGQYLARIYGILCEPKTPGKYPAVLRVPGAGVRPYSGNKDLAARGAVTLDIGIHGIPVNLPSEVYDQLRSGGLNGYHLYNLDNKNLYYYRRVYLSCIRANDFLTSRPMYDGENLVVTGGSQGGQLSIVTAALDPRVKGLAPQFPAYCDVTGYLHGRAGGWPHMFRPDAGTGENFHATAPKIATTSYYDTVNFAKRVKVPGHYTWGYNDETCPPTSIYAAFNQINAHKELVVALEANHPIIPEQTDAVSKWIGGFLKLAK